MESPAAWLFRCVRCAALGSSVPRSLIAAGSPSRCGSTTSTRTSNRARTSRRWSAVIPFRRSAARSAREASSPKLWNALRASGRKPTGRPSGTTGRPSRPGTWPPGQQFLRLFSKERWDGRPLDCAVQHAQPLLQSLRLSRVSLGNCGLCHPLPVAKNPDDLGRDCLVQLGDVDLPAVAVTLVRLRPALALWPVNRSADPEALQHHGPEAVADAGPVDPPRQGLGDLVVLLPASPGRAFQYRLNRLPGGLVEWRVRQQDGHRFAVLRLPLTVGFGLRVASVGFTEVAPAVRRSREPGFGVRVSPRRGTSQLRSAGDLLEVERLCHLARRCTRSTILATASRAPGSRTGCAVVPLPSRRHPREGLPPGQPGTALARLPATLRTTIDSLSNWAKTAITPTTARPAGVEVSNASDRETKSTPSACSSSIRDITLATGRPRRSSPVDDQDVELAPCALRRLR